MNPKAIVFLAAVLPQHADPEQGRVPAQLTRNGPGRFGAGTRGEGCWANRQEEGGAMRARNLTVTAVLGVALLAGCGGSSDKSAASEISLKTCAADPAGGKPKAEGSIVNHTSKPSAYTFRIRFLDASGNEVSQGTSAVGRVEPGTTFTWKVEGGQSAKGALNCKVANQTRTPLGTEIMAASQAHA